MKVLVAEDDRFQRELLESLLQEWRYEVVSVTNGMDAFKTLQRPESPSLAILDWQMPYLSGPEICTYLRAEPARRPRHLILLTASTSGADVQRGLDAGADDFVRKPFDELELKARVRAGIRSIALETELADRIRELESAKECIRTLEGILPICSYCKKIRDHQNDWQTVEVYVAARSQAQFSHGICPGCYQSVIEPQLRDLQDPPRAGSKGDC